MKLKLLESIAAAGIMALAFSGCHSQIVYVENPVKEKSVVGKYLWTTTTITSGVKGSGKEKGFLIDNLYYEGRLIHSETNELISVNNKNNKKVHPAAYPRL